MNVELDTGLSFHLQFSLFGAFGLRASSGPALTTARRAGREFIQYMALHPRVTVTRERLIDAFWPDADAETGAHRLHVAASGARIALRPFVDVDPIKCTIDGYGWHPDIVVQTDVERFEACHANGTLEGFATGVSLFTGELLAGECADWIVRRRLHLASKFVTMLERLAGAAFERAAYDEAMPFAARLVALDRAHEEATRLIMRCFARMGQRSFALAEYALLRAHLKQYLGVVPTPATEALRERIARGESS